MRPISPAPSPGGTLMILPGVSHFAPLQPPARFNAALAGLSRRAPGLTPGTRRSSGRSRGPCRRSCSRPVRFTAQGGPVQPPGHLQVLSPGEDDRSPDSGSRCPPRCDPCQPRTAVQVERRQRNGATWTLDGRLPAKLPADTRHGHGMWLRAGQRPRDSFRAGATSWALIGWSGQIRSIWQVRSVRGTWRGKPFTEPVRDCRQASRSWCRGR
jgi:hypothetical protein